MRQLVPFLISIFFIFSFTSGNVFSQSTDSFSEDVRWALQDLPDSVDNLDWRSLDRWYIITHLFDTLVAFDIHQNLCGALAESWNISDDRLILNFLVRRDARFSNGRQIRSEDVVFSIKRYLIQQKAPHALKSAIIGADQLKLISDRISGLKAVDDRTVQIRLNFPLENIWSFLSLPQIGGVVAKESVEPRTLRMLAYPVTSGPYSLSWLTRNSVQLVKNTFYYNYNSHAPQTVAFYRYDEKSQAVEWFQSGKTNFYSILDPFEVNEIDMLSRKEFISYPLHRVGFLYLNQRKGFLKKKINRAIIAGSFSERNLKKHKNPLLVWGNSFFPPGSSGYIPNLSDNIVEELGKVDTDDIKEPVEILLEAGMPKEKVEYVLTERFSQIGIDIKFKYLSKREIAKRFVTGNFEIGMTSVGLPMADHALGIYSYFIEKPAYFADPSGKINEFFNVISKTNRDEEKKEQLSKINRQIFQDNVVIPIFHTAVRYIISDELELLKSKNYRVDVQLVNIRKKERQR